MSSRGAGRPRDVVLAGLLLASCASGHIRSAAVSGASGLPPPERVVVYDFATSPAEVRLNQAPGARLRRLAGTGAVGEAQAEAARSAQTSLAAALSQKLQTYGLPVVQASLGTPAPAPPALVVEGQILSINQGNRARRVLVGFGAGKSSMSADAEIVYLPPGGGPPVQLASFTADSDSGRAPGAAGTMGVGAAAGGLATSAAVSGGLHGVSEMRSTGEQANARHLANTLGVQIGKLAASQGWIAPAVVH